MLQYLKLVSSSSQDSTPDLRHRGLLSGRRPGRDQLHRGRVQARGADLLGGQWEKGTFKLSHVANAMKVLQAFIFQVCNYRSIFAIQYAHACFHFKIPTNT